MNKKGRILRAKNDFPVMNDGVMAAARTQRCSPELEESLPQSLSVSRSLSSTAAVKNWVYSGLSRKCKRNVKIHTCNGVLVSDPSGASANGIAPVAALMTANTKQPYDRAVALPSISF
jgi:hypothetical protein